MSARRRPDVFRFTAEPGYHGTVIARNGRPVQGRDVVVDDPYFDFVLALQFRPSADGSDVELRHLEVRARDGGPPITPAGVMGLRLADILEKVRRSLPGVAVRIFDDGESIEVVDHAPATPHVFRTRPARGPNARQRAMAVAAKAWTEERLRNPSASIGKLDEVAAEAAELIPDGPHVAPRTVACWRSRYKEEWNALVS